MKAASSITPGVTSNEGCIIGCLIIIAALSEPTQLQLQGRDCSCNYKEETTRRWIAVRKLQLSLRGGRCHIASSHCVVVQTIKRETMDAGIIILQSTSVILRDRADDRTQNHGRNRSS